MTKRTTAFELILPPRDASTPAYRWLDDALRAAILDGRLRPGARLPGTRELAEQYGLSRGTIVNAFEQLKAEGYLDGNVGSGTFVCRTLPDDLLHVRSAGFQPAVPLASSRPAKLSAYARRLRAESVLELRPSRAFRTNVPALELFPTALWAQLAARRWRRPPQTLLLSCDPLGYRPLRDAVADYLTASRGVRCTAEQIVIVSGVQEALDLAARLLLDPGDRVCVEDPGYGGASNTFAAAGAKVIALPVDDEGMQVSASKLRGARLVYVTPAHQFPLGMTMSLRRRLALLEWARRAPALIFEDDYDSEYRYSGRPVPALQGLDRDGVVLFGGSFNKVLFPSLRLGYLVVPENLVALFEAARSSTMRHPPLTEQAVLCDFIEAGHFARHLRRMRAVYAERLSVLLAAARSHLDGLLEISPIEAGLHTIGWLRDGIDAEQAATAAATRHVEVTPLSRHARRPLPREGLQLGFGAVGTGEIRREVRELAAALASLH